MKIGFLVLFVLNATYSFAQDHKKLKNVKPGKDAHGYIGNTRLDSIDSRYAEIELMAIPFEGTFRLLFKYAHQTGSDAQFFVQNNTRSIYQFENLISALNFLDDNGWNYLDSITKPDYQIIILRKKQ